MTNSARGAVEVGTDGRDTSSPSIQARRQDLENRKAQITEKITSNRNGSRAAGVTGPLLLILAGLLIWLGYGPRLIPLLVAYLLAVPIGIVGMIVTAIMTTYSNKSLELDLLDVQQDLELLNYHDATEEQRAEKLFRLHQAELKKYYDISRSQSVQIFYVGIGCMVFGVGIIAAALLIVVQAPYVQLADRIVIAALGAVGSIITNFIGVVFLRMYSGTINSMTAFHSRLVATHHLHYGTFLAAKISDPVLREQTLSKMAVQSAETLSNERAGPAA